MDDVTPNFRRWSGASKARALGAVAAIAVAPLVAWGVMFRMPGTTHAGALAPLSPHEVGVEAVLRGDLHHLAATVGERNVLRPEGLARARDWIEAQLHAAGYETARQTYDADGIACSNVVAERRGRTRPGETVLIGAHYDSARGSPGANDNGSGLVALLQLAREIAQQQPERSVRFVAFVNEEPPYFWTARMGSAVHARRARADNDAIVAMMSLETMGSFSDAPGSQKYPFPMILIYPDRGNFIAFIGNVASRALVRDVVGTFRQTASFPSEGAALPERTTGVGWSDHKPFWDAGYPALMVTDTALFRYRHYHTRDDTDDKVDTARLARIVSGLMMRVVEHLSRE